METKNFKTCKQIEGLLIDYADNQLSVSESGRVKGHLSNCPDCSQKLEALQQSLSLTQSLWQQNLSKIDDIKIPAAKRARLKWPWPAAAAILLTAGIFAIFSTETAPIEPPQPLLTLAQIERDINRAGIAAKHLAAAEQLKKYPDGETMVQNQYRYIAKAYPNTTAAVKAKLLIK